MQESCFPELFTKSWKVHLAKTLVRRDGQLECSTLQMVDKNLKIVGLNVSVFGGASKEIVRMLYDELVKRSRRRNDNGTQTSNTSSSAPRRLPSGRNRSRITSHHARIEQP